MGMALRFEDERLGFGVKLSGEVLFGSERYVRVDCHGF